MYHQDTNMLLREVLILLTIVTNVLMLIIFLIINAAQLNWINALTLTALDTIKLKAVYTEI